eukprot:2462238-Amphidinium_carterae.2
MATYKFAKHEMETVLEKWFGMPQVIAHLTETLVGFGEQVLGCVSIEQFQGCAPLRPNSRMSAARHCATFMGNNEFNRLYTDSGIGLPGISGG